MEIRNILWYVNGTLFDTLPAITYSFSKALTEMEFSVALNVIDGLVRQSFDDCVVTLSQRFQLDSGILRHKYSEFYRTISPANQPPFPGARDVCEFIHHNNGLNIAIIDGSLDPALKLLEAHQFSPFIDDSLTVEQEYSRTSNASMLRLVLEQHKLNPTRTLVVSNRDSDVEAGRLAGVCTCLFGKADLISEADLLIEKYGQLLDALDSKRKSDPNGVTNDP
jgi:phosphoglycolate phosphatase-like HAD superfamily hydrolase